MTQKKDYRYERKFIFEGKEKKLVEKMISSHPAHFSEAFHERKINNIYFDFFSYSNYHENEIGNSQRIKMRIRWYGDTFGKITKPILELKIKEGQLGRKESYTLKGFILSKNFTFTTFKNYLLKHNTLPPLIKEIIKHSRPVILNSYLRKYFISQDSKFRITIDNNLRFYRLRNLTNTFLDTYSETDGIIIEVKYNKEYDSIADTITSFLPLRLTASSKYVFGIEMLYF